MRLAELPWNPLSPAGVAGLFTSVDDIWCRPAGSEQAKSPWTKDAADFHAVLPLLSAAQHRWK